MNEFVVIFNLMKQAPEFSTVISGLFVYFAYFYITTKNKETIKDMLKPVVQDITDIKKEMILIKQNICSKNGF